MVFLETWILLVDVQFKVIGEVFPVITSDQDSTYALAVEVKKYWQRRLTNVQPTKFTVWRLSDKAPDIDFEDHQKAQQQVSDAFSTMQVSRRPARGMYPRLTHKRRASYGHALRLSD